MPEPGSAVFCAGSPSPVPLPVGCAEGELWIDPARAEGLWDALFEAGQLPDITELVGLGPEALFADIPNSGYIRTGSLERVHKSYYPLPDGTVLETTDAELVLTPGELGQVTGIIAVSGYNLYTETFPVI